MKLSPSFLITLYIKTRMYNTTVFFYRQVIKFLGRRWLCLEPPVWRVVVPSCSGSKSSRGTNISAQCNWLTDKNLTSNPAIDLRITWLHTFVVCTLSLAVSLVSRCVLWKVLIFLCTFILSFEYSFYRIRVFITCSSFVHKSISYIPTNDDKIETGCSF